MLLLVALLAGGMGVSQGAGARMSAAVARFVRRRRRSPLTLGAARIGRRRRRISSSSAASAAKRSTRPRSTTSHAPSPTRRQTRWGIPDADDIWLGEDSVAANRPHYRGQATKVNVEQTLTKLAARAGPGDQIVLVLIGHGSGEGEETKISIPGPDLSARDFAQLLARFPTQKVAFINLTSASGDMLPVISGPNRVVITATKSAFERNESQFARFFVDALSKDVADVDKDGRVSLLEAFRYADVETKRVYENDTKLQTEHAQFDDMGMKVGVAEPDGREKQGCSRAASSSTAASTRRLARAIRSSRRSTRTSSRSRIRSMRCARRRRR